MKKGQVLGWVSGVLAVGILIFLLVPVGGSSGDVAPSPGLGDVAEPGVAPLLGSRTSGVQAPVLRPGPGRSHPLATDVEQALLSSRALYEPRAQLTQEETLALMADREAAADRVEEAVAKLPASELAGVREALGATSSSREKMTLVRGLGEHMAGEAVQILVDTYEEQGIFRIREEILRALGDSSATGHIELAVRVMLGEGPASADPRLRQIAAQSLYGEAEALGALERLLGSAAPIAVKLEAIHSIGGIGSAAARRVLDRVVTSAATPERVRQYAEQELLRMAT